MAINAKSTVYCVLGDPVAHSRSPVMHNAAFAAAGINDAYVAFRVKDIAGAVGGIRALGIGGASITIPHKVSAMAHLDEVDEEARRIGAVNTVVNRDGRLVGHNTDWQGAIRALLEKTVVRGRTVLVIGAGGAARAVAYGVAREGGRLLIADLTVAGAKPLARDFGGDALAVAEAGSCEWDVLINTSPVGMAPDSDVSPVPREWFRPGGVVMDIVYNPLKTRLLKEAAECGCETIDGLAMFVYQGAAQFEAWTGRPAPVEVMRQAVLVALQTDEE
ncbi:MAG: shikimate dehydrogenase [Thermodesulfobacteriota bacterium]